MKRLRIDTSMNDRQKHLAIEAALLYGFQTEFAEFPVASPDGEIGIPETEEELLSFWRKEGTVLPEGYVAAKKKGPLFDTDFRKGKGLEKMFETGDFLKDEDFDLLPEKLDVKIVLPEKADTSVMTAACNFAFRLGMETIAYEDGILADEGYQGNAIIFESSDTAEINLERREDAVRVHVKGKGEELVKLSSSVCEKFPKADAWRSWRDVLMDMADDFILRGADGQISCLHALEKEDAGAYEVYGAPEITDAQKEHFPNAIFHNYKSGRKVYEKVYELPWEVDTLKNTLAEKIYPVLKAGDIVRLEAAVSEDKKVRDALTEEIEEAVAEKGAELIGTQLICAYKQGFSWIDEIVIPEAARVKASKIEIYFKPFLPEGQTEWLDENGATPSYHNLKADNPDKWYDLPIRYLQELYPIEDILVEKLGINREDVVFLPYEGKENITYLCRVEGEEVQEFTYLARCSERPYMDEYPQMGKVHPSTGYVKVWINDEVVLEEEIQTDLERVWNVYQSEVLPDCRKYIEEKTGGRISADLQPFFNKLSLDVTVSEPDFRTGSREDLISSLDALHEDMYFVASDYFKNYGVQRADVMLDAPGLILPEIHNREGAPVFKVTLYEQLREKAAIVKDGQDAEVQKERGEVRIWIQKIRLSDDKLELAIETTGVSDAWLSSYAELFGKGVLETAKNVSEDYRIVFIGSNGEEYGADVPQKPNLPKKKITEIDLHEHELIGYDTYREIIEELRQVEEIEVFRTAVSYAGREIYAIWLKPKYKGYLSITKRLSRLPSEIINARHHANEVSSTNASFILLKKLLTEDIYKDLPEKMNLVLVPMENVDGASIHYELQKEHPNWKLHVARFNSIGKEFYYEHFQKDTIHTEAMGLTRLFEKYVPDMIVDNHGVPSHEWEQQFSGYTSPSYKGFWLPRSLLYGYFWYVTNPEYKDNYPVNKVMEDVIADEMAKDAEMTKWNLEWSAQFEKYAHAWMPKLFPANYYKDMINYWIPFAFDPKHRYPSIRFPWITTVAYTSEVADETAQGEYLNLCARAHVAHDEATLQMLMKAEHVFESECGIADHKVFARYYRLRPMIVGNSGENK
ncbi:MAG: M14 family metallopeptidase [Bariatricus sp.]|nr:M14 family metallopeptidase [Bariatricus sp.]